MAKKALFQYEESQPHILHLKTTRHLQETAFRILPQTLVLFKNMISLCWSLCELHVFNLFFYVIVQNNFFCLAKQLLCLICWEILSLPVCRYKRNTQDEVDNYFSVEEERHSCPLERHCSFLYRSSRTVQKKTLRILIYYIKLIQTSTWVWFIYRSAHYIGLYKITKL